ncbi:MAG: TolC family protein [Acidobacteria bacterium]|uniref:TolC family protein n=1 Tax=Candidatus Polarisedimenticola svalbardensis TaxID=2886004 RepID=A0A8J7C1K9_9BACT|nr:TolC family protein [Candidatus Polarisedimenticola svalbardensis]
MRGWIIGLLLLALAAAPVTGAGGEALEPLTLEEAIQIAMEGNRQLDIASASADAAEQSSVEARSHLVPRVDLIEDFSWTTNPVYVFGNLLGQESFTAANFDIGFLNQPDSLTNFRTQVMVSQPVYTGGKIRSGVDAARAGRDAAESDRERTRQQVVHQVLDAYTGAVLAERYREVAGESLKTSQAHEKLVADMYQAGLVVESDLLQVQVRRTEIEEMVIRAESAAAVSMAGLNMVMGEPMGKVYALSALCDSGACKVEDEEALEVLVNEARAGRPDLKASALKAEAASLMIREARSGGRPEVGVSGIYEANAEDFIGADGTNWSVMAHARLRLFGGKEVRAKVARSEAEHRMALSASELMGQSVELEVRTAFHELKAARKRIEQAGMAVGLAGASLVMVEDRYREGLTTLVELMEAETALTSARTREVQARRDLLLADATLKLAIGRL